MPTEAQVEVSEEDEEAYARAICKADGFDPDAWSSSGHAKFPDAGYPTWHDYRSHARAVLALARRGAGQAVPDGWVLVPKEPTEEMVKAWAADDGRPLAGVSWRELARYDWEAFLSAVPNPEAAPDMLATLKETLDRLLSQAEARNYDPPADPEIIADIEWAIAKAEGRSSEGC